MMINFHAPISRREIRNGLQNGAIVITTADGIGETVVKIGDFWFYAFGLEDETESPEEYVANTPMADIVDEIYEALEGIRTGMTEPEDDGIEPEWAYYRAYLRDFARRTLSAG